MGQNSKYLYLVIGIIIGIAIGSAVVWWMQNYDFKIWFTFSGKDDKSKEIVESMSDNDIVSDLKKDKSTIKYDKTKRNSNNNSQTDTISDNYANDTNTVISEGNNDIVIAKDEYLATRLIEVKGFNRNNSKDNKLDSILINDKTKANYTNIIKTEFWRSPINYKGYKFINNNLILFGIYDFDEVILEFSANKLYMNYKNNYFYIEKTSNFQPLIQLKSKI